MQRRIAASYLQFAKGCLRTAERAHPKDRKRLFRIAQVWLQLANDNLSEGPRVRPPAPSRPSYPGH